MSGPSLPTVKRLFAVSGNRCAFPNCTNWLVDEASGKVTGRICHIKARNPNGARYDPDQTDEERHEFENLMLMCPIHHDVIDADPESYTVERLQDIKAKHEANYGEGSEPGDDIAFQLLANAESNVALNLSATDHGKIDWSGDVLQGSVKVVAQSINIPGEQEHGAEVENLIRDIQSALYDDYNRLPYVLTLCLDLCDQASLSNEYSGWLKRELNGYRNYEEFRQGFKSDEEFEAWMDKWASHRLANPYIKITYRSQETGRLMTAKWPLDKSLIGFPIAEIARIIHRARESGSSEIFGGLAEVSRRQFEEVKTTLLGFFPGTYIPSDLQIFYSVSSLEQVLDGVREVVLSLLGDARTRIG